MLNQNKIDSVQNKVTNELQSKLNLDRPFTDKELVFSKVGFSKDNNEAVVAARILIDGIYDRQGPDAYIYVLSLSHADNSAEIISAITVTEFTLGNLDELNAIIENRNSIYLQYSLGDIPVVRHLVFTVDQWREVNTDTQVLYQAIQEDLQVVLNSENLPDVSNLRLSHLELSNDKTVSYRHASGNHKQHLL